MDCPRCALAAPAGARFCPACGTRLAAAADIARFTSPHAYTPAHLAERILTGRATVEGERKQVTVLFADLKSSMELLADRDPEEAEPLLNEVLDLMMEAVHRFEGTVNQVMGDGIMALFGAPLAVEDHAVRAAYAALRMQERIGAFGDVAQRQHGLPVQIRIGLNSGEVVVRAIETDLRMSYTAVGQTVHLAARMEQMAKPGSVLATAATIALAGARVRSRPLGPVRVRGLGWPVEVHEVLGATEVRTRVEAAQRDLTRFVGRERELAALGAALAAVRGGAGRIVAVAGEAGVGKSRLLHEFAAGARAAGCLMLETVALPYGRAMGHRSGLDMIRRYFDQGEADDPSTTRERAAARLTSLDLSLEDAVAPMLWLMEALRPESPFLALEAAVRRRRAIDAVVRLVAHEARSRPVILLFEDLQWIDSVTEASLDGLIQRLPPGVLVILTYRPGYDDRWQGRPDHARIRVDALGGAEAAAMIAFLLGGDPGVAALAPQLVERSGGNPLFLEECVRSLVAAGVLAGERGRYRLARPVATVDVPPTVRAVLEARIDRLPADVKRVLQCAAAIGEEFRGALLEAVADLPPDRVRHALDALEEAELVAQTALFPDPGYAFVHSLIHDVAYEGLLHDRRRALHARVVDALERSGAERGAGADVGALAHHAFRGELWARAVRYLREAAARPLAQVPGREAVMLLEHALTALAQLPDTAESRALAVDVRCDLRNVLVPLGEHARMLAVLADAEAIARSLDDEARLARVLSYQSNVLWDVGESERSVDTAQRTLAIAERLGDVGLQVVSNLGLGGGYRTLGDYRRAVGHLRRNLALLAGPAARERFGLPGAASVLSTGHLVWSLAELGEFDEAVALAEEAMRRAEAVGDPYSLAHAHLGLGGVLVRQGRFGEAMGVLEAGYARTEDVPVLRPPTAADLAFAYALSGRPVRALELAESAVRDLRRMGRVGRLSLITTHLGEVHLLAGRLDAAGETGRQALELARVHRERGNEVYALRLLGLVASEGTPPKVAEAREAYGEAIRLAETLGMRPLLARCHLGIGRLARATGDGPGAARHLEAATALLREMRMSFWLERLDLDRVGPPAAA